MLLDFIYRTETGKGPPDCYGVVYGHNQGKLAKPLISMTLDEVEADGPRRTKAYGSSAAGAAQFMRDTLDKPGTLLDIEGEMGLSGKELFAPDLQDRMAYHLLKRRGYLRFIAGDLSLKAFGLGLAKEWASLPVLSDTTGQKRKVTRGQSYYAGDGRNKALVAPVDVEAILAEVLNAVDQKPQPTIPFPDDGLPADPTGPLPPTSTPPRTGKGWGCLGWSIFGLVVVAGLAIAAFTVRF
ncbi:hypothetical protein ASC68_13685 [Devosia sp. Root105]|nr:hypothetical protein ASC68_13685 [Devosia sp. Root105]